MSMAKRRPVTINSSINFANWSNAPAVRRLVAAICLKHPDGVATFYKLCRHIDKKTGKLILSIIIKKDIIMKTIVLSALISVAALGNSFAATTTTNPSDKKSSISTLKEAENLYLHNIEVVYSQYRLAEARIKASPGNHAELERDRQFFVSVYQQDIDNGVRVEQSKEAIAEIEDRYARLHAERDAYEANEIAKLQQHMEKAFKKEDKAFAKAKRGLSKTATATR